jgi:nitroreductase
MISNFRNSPFITKFFGFEPWHFIVVQDPALRELIKPVAEPLKLDTKSFCIRFINESATGKARFSIYFVYDEGKKNAC